MSHDFRELEEIFDEACSLDEISRAEFLARRCAGHPELRAEVERFLRSHQCERAANAAANAVTSQRRFGVWQTVRLLGRGGMGEVWLARRVDGQHEQQAAVKVLSPYLAGPESLDRFKRERQLLARLEHPGIARLLDGGMNEYGEPYLVMEYVEGVRLDRYCDHHRLAIEARLRLFLKVCDAVTAAHQHFVVHRDIKPGNILVSADGQPKLLDFGIAKVIDADVGLELTATANLFLTPLYASPEILHGEPATVASDVYSLGVVVYELLSGHRPFDSDRMSPAGLVEATTRRNAQRPSVAVSRGATGEIAGARSTTPDRLRSTLHGDLDAIVLKALATNIAERYASAMEFASDIERYLDGQPVIAVQPSRLYVARKFARRHRVGVAATLLLVLSIAAGLAGTLRQARIAQQQRALAEQRFRDARQMTNYMLFDLYDAIGKNPGNLPVQADMTQRSLEYLDRLAAIRSDDPGLRLELGEGYMRLGAILAQGFGLSDSLGDTTKAIDTDRKALAVVEPVLRQQPSNAAARRILALIEAQLGSNLARIARDDEAFSWTRKSADAFEQLAKDNPRSATALVDAGVAWQTYGRELIEKGGYTTVNADIGAEPFRKSVTDLTASLAIDPANPHAVVTLAETYFLISKSESSASPRKSNESVAAGLKVLAQLPPERQNAETNRLRALMLLRQGWNQGQLGEYPEALKSIDDACAQLDKLAQADPGNLKAEFRRVDAYRSLGLVHGYAGQREASLASLRKAADILAPLVKKDPSVDMYAALLAELQGRVANLLVQTGRSAQAPPFAEASVAYYKRLGDSATATPQQLIEAVRSVGETEVKSLRDRSAALRFAQRADKLSNGKNPAVLGYLAEALEMNNRFPEAMEAARRGLAQMPAGNAPSKLRTWLSDEVRNDQAKAPRPRR